MSGGPAGGAGDDRVPEGLTIGDLAERTGVPVATLRAWETRHGFPVAHRRPSGHRRYPDATVVAVREVLRLRAAGVRLATAVARVQATAGPLGDCGPAGQPAPVTSVFAQLSRHPRLTPQRLRKATVLSLTAALEDECCARAQRPMLFAAFQHHEFYRQAELRWRELARTARQTVVFARFDDLPAAPATMLVPLPPDAPMLREWVLVCDAVDRPAALVAWEPPGRRAGRDEDRVFETVWTLEPALVREAARACTELARTLAPDLTLEPPPLEVPTADPSGDLSSALFQRIVAYLDHRR